MGGRKPGVLGVGHSAGLPTRGGIVPPGERGLRQNEAVYAHLRQLSGAAEELKQAAAGSICSIMPQTPHLSHKPDTKP